MRRMRILQLTSHLNAGGITTTVLTLAERLKQRGHAVMVGSGGGAHEPDLRTLGVAHWRLPLHTSAEYSLPVAWAGWQLARRLRSEPVDLVHAHTRVAQVVAHGLWTSRRIPYVTTWHGFYRPRLSRRWSPCTGLLTIAISPPVAYHLKKEFRVPHERIRVIPHGVDVSRYGEAVSAAELQALRARAGLGASGPVVGAIARLTRDKGVEQLLRAFAYVAVRVPSAQLLIVGDGPDRLRLEALAKELDINHAAAFVGTLPETRVALALMSTFVFLPAEKEGFGLVLLEAMASGVPIVAVRRGGGSTWLLDETEAGLTVQPDKPERLGETIAQLLRDTGYAKRLAERARQTAIERFDLERAIDQVEAVYEECVNQARGAK
ncbi:MAG: glycosyltransferase family 4 protein [Candidatus Omnitrophica bacterium]|nr:glycosyltransferase family 4 protein [Candidatus Omnitrophota bacterium]